MIMKKLRLYSTRLRKNEEGATAIEYGLFAALIAAVIAFSVSTLGQSVKSKFDAVNTEINRQTSTSGSSGSN